MPDGLITALVAAAVSGLSWIAYSHPLGFKRIYWPLSGVVFLVMACLNAYSIGVGRGFGAAIPFLPVAKTASAEAAAKQLTPDGLTVLLIYFCVLIFLSVLLWLPEILGLDENGNRKS